MLNVECEDEGMNVLVNKNCGGRGGFGSGAGGCGLDARCVWPLAVGS